MSRKVLLAGSSLVIAFLLTLVLLLTLAWAMPERGPATGPATANVGSPSASKTITGYAQTDEEPPRPVQNALIVAMQGLDIIAETQTDANGDYTLSLDVSTCRVCAQTTDIISPTGVMAPSRCQSVFFGPLEDTKTVTFTFQAPDAQIVGRLLISETLNPPAFPVTITVREGFQTVASQQINPNGAFTVPVPAGTYNVVADPENLCYASEELLLAHGIEVTGTYDLGDKYLSQVIEAATLGGHVKTPQDQPVSGIGVRAVKADFSFTGFMLRSLNTNTEGEFSFCIPSSLAEGTWWVGVALGSTDEYMPYPLEWWETVSISATQVVTDIELLVRPATALISATLIKEQSGEPATDACGVVAAYKQGEPTVYNARPFAGGTFNLPVVTGTYRLVVIPDPGLPITSANQSLGLYPDECVESAGKYLVKTVPSVPVTQPLTTTVPITVRVADATIHGRLWDVTEQITVTGVEGQILGWSQGNWSATRVQTDTGVGDLRASSGSDWLLAYHVDPGSVYQELPGVALAQVPTGTTDLTVDLRLWESHALITGTVLTPSGDPVTAAVAVAAVGLGPAPSYSRQEGLEVGMKPRGDTMIVHSGGQFTLTLRYGVYMVTVFGPPEVLSDNAWISPEPQIVILTPADPYQERNLQFRLGDATIHGHLALASTVQAAGGEEHIRPPALVWAATAGGHTKTWVDMTENGDYSLPVLQGKRWTVGAAYEVGRHLWITQTVIAVPTGTTDIPLDLTLTQAYSLATWLVQSIDSHLPFYGELGSEVGIGALGQAERRSSYAVGIELQIPPGALPQGHGTLHLKPSLVNPLANGAPMPPIPAMPSADVSALASEIPPEGVALLTPAYEVTVVDDMGYVATDEELNAPMVLTISYDEDTLATYGFSEGDIQAVYLEQEVAGWEVVEEYVVDEEANKVVIFADRLGSYALITTQEYHQIFLPLILRGYSSFTSHW